MNEYVKIGSISAGSVVGLFVGLVVLAAAPKAINEGLSCMADTTDTAKPCTTAVPYPVYHTDTLQIHDPIPRPVLDRLDSLQVALMEKDSALAAAVIQLRRPVGITFPWRVDVDSSRVVIGKMRVDYCPDNGEWAYTPSIDTLIVPENIREITRTVAVFTGIEWYWIPAAVIVGALIAVGLYAWVAA